MTPRVAAVGLLLLVAASSHASQPAAVPDLGEPVVLTVRQDRVVLDDGLLGFSNEEGGIYLPLGQLCRDLGLAIDVDVTLRRAAGFYLAEHRTFRLDAEAGVVESAGRRFPLPRGSVVAARADLYVRLEALRSWLKGVELHYSPRSLTLDVDSDPPLPALAKLSRDAERRRAEAVARHARPQLPVVTAPFRILGRPVVDIDLESRRSSRGERSRALRIRATHDLFHMGARWFLELDADGTLRQSRLALHRKDPSGGLLGPLAATAVEIGDISGLTAPLVGGGVEGIGFRLSNRPRKLSEGAAIDLRGDLPAGWEAELYHNGHLVGFDGEPRRGEYAFPEVALYPGLNDLEVVLHGPHGQRRVTRRSLRLGGHLPAPGLRYLEASAVLQGLGMLPPPTPTPTPPPTPTPAPAPSKPDSGSLVAHASMSWGLRPGVAAAGRLSVLPVGARKLVFASAEATWSLPAVELSAGGALDQQGRWAGSTRLVSGLRGGVALLFEHEEYSPGYRSPWSVRGEPARRRSDLRLRHTLNPRRLAAPLQATLRARLTQGLDGRSATDVQLTASTSVGPWRLRSTMAGGRTSASGGSSRINASGSFDLDYRGGERSLGAGLSFSMAPEARWTGVRLSARTSLLDDSLWLRPTLEHRFSGPTSVGLVLGWRLPRLDLSLRLTAAGDGSWSATAGARFSIDWRRHAGFPRMHGRALSSRSLAYAEVFLDEDRDGVPSPGDSAVAGARLTPRGWSDATDDRGLSLVSLSELAPTDITLDESSLGDPFLRSGNTGFQVSARPGAPLILYFPVVRVGDVEGVVTVVETEDGAATTRGLGNAELVIFDRGGVELARRRSELDGFFAIGGLPLGAHRLRLDPAQAAHHGLDDGGGVELVLDAERPLLTGIELRLVSLPGWGDLGSVLSGRAASE